MATQVCTNSSVLMVNGSVSHQRRRTNFHQIHPLFGSSPSCDLGNTGTRKISISTRCSAKPIETLRTCKNCKTQFDPSRNHPRACRYHTAHFGGETKRKFESVHSGGTTNTPESGKISLYWHCCGSEDPFDPGCTAAPHFSYDD